MLRHHVGEAASRSAYEADCLLATANMSKHAGLSCRASILEGRAEDVARAPIPRIDYRHTEQRLLDPEASGLNTSRHYGGAGWAHNRLHPYDRSDLVTDALLRAQAHGVGHELRNDQGLADAIIREEGIGDEYRHRLIAPHIDSAVCEEVANHMDFYDQSTKAAVMRSRAQQAEHKSAEAHPATIDELHLSQLKAFETSKVRAALCPNAMARAEMELRHQDMLSSNELLYGHPRGRFI